MNKNIIIISIILVAFIGVVIFLDIPNAQSVLKLRKEIEIEKANLLEKQSIVSKIDKLVDIFDENQEEFKKVDYVLPSEEEIPNLIVQIKSIALEAGVVLESVGFGELKESVSSKAQGVRGVQEETKNYKTMSINLTFSGDYLGFKNFLGLMEENIRLMDIQSITFSNESSGEVETQLFNFDVVLNTYYQ